MFSNNRQRKEGRRQPRDQETTPALWWWHGSDAFPAAVSPTSQSCHHPVPPKCHGTRLMQSCSQQVSYLILFVFPVHFFPSLVAKDREPRRQENKWLRSAEHWVYIPKPARVTARDVLLSNSPAAGQLFGKPGIRCWSWAKALSDLVKVSCRKRH